MFMRSLYLFFFNLLVCFVEWQTEHMIWEWTELLLALGYVFAAPLSRYKALDTSLGGINLISVSPINLP